MVIWGLTGYTEMKAKYFWHLPVQWVCPMKWLKAVIKSVSNFSGSDVLWIASWISFLPNMCKVLSVKEKIINWDDNFRNTCKPGTRAQLYKGWMATQRISDNKTYSVIHQIEIYPAQWIASSNLQTTRASSLIEESTYPEKFFYIFLVLFNSEDHGFVFTKSKFCQFTPTKFLKSVY